MKRCILLGVFAGSLVACYSPAYDDCAVRCNNGDECPSGYMCQMPERVCRKPELVGETCTPAGGGDARVDTVTGDGSDAPSATYCAQQAGALRCHDFDTVNAPDQGWPFANYEQDGTNVLLTSVSVSPPNSYESQLQTFTTQPVYARLIDTFTPDDNTTRIVVGLNMLMAQRTSPQSAVELFDAGAPGHLGVTARSPAGGTGIEFVHVNGPQPMTDVSVDATQWTRWEMVFQFTGNTVEMLIHKNGQLHTTLGTEPRPPNGTSWQIQVGGFTSAPNGTTRIDYDNILVTRM